MTYTIEITVATKGRLSKKRLADLADRLVKKAEKEAKVVQAMAVAKAADV